jgi:hypothetical protein
MYILLFLNVYPRIYLVKNADRIRTNDHVVVQEYLDKVTSECCMLLQGKDKNFALYILFLANAFRRLQI